MIIMSQKKSIHEQKLLQNGKKNQMRILKWENSIIKMKTSLEKDKVSRPQVRVISPLMQPEEQSKTDEELCAEY